MLDSLVLDKEKSDSIIFGKFIEELRNQWLLKERLGRDYSKFVLQVTLEQDTKAQSVSRCIALLFI